LRIDRTRRTPSIRFCCTQGAANKVRWRTERAQEALVAATKRPITLQRPHAMQQRHSGIVSNTRAHASRPLTNYFPAHTRRDRRNRHLASAITAHPDLLMMLLRGRHYSHNPDRAVPPEARRHPHRNPVLWRRLPSRSEWPQPMAAAARKLPNTELRTALPLFANPRELGARWVSFYAQGPAGEGPIEVDPSLTQAEDWGVSAPPAPSPAAEPTDEGFGRKECPNAAATVAMRSKAEVQGEAALRQSGVQATKRCPQPAFRRTTAMEAHAPVLHAASC